MAHACGPNAASCLRAGRGGSNSSGPKTLLILEPEPGAQVEDMDAALDSAKAILEQRLKAFAVDHGSVKRVSDKQITIRVPVTITEDIMDTLLQPGHLQFCEPITNDAGQVLLVLGGEMQYEPQSCEPVRDASGNVSLDGGSTAFFDLINVPDRSLIVWQPATAIIDGRQLSLTGEFLERDSFVDLDRITNQPLLTFAWNETGSKISGEITERLAERSLPLAPFLDGEPIIGDDGQLIAPNVQSKITSSGQITGLSEEEANKLSILLNSGALPIRLTIVSTTRDGE